MIEVLSDDCGKLLRGARSRLGQSPAKLGQLLQSPGEFCIQLRDHLFAPVEDFKPTLQFLYQLEQSGIVPLMLPLQGVQKIESFLHALNFCRINLKTRLITDYASFQLFEFDRCGFMGAQKITSGLIKSMEFPQLSGNVSQST